MVRVERDVVLAEPKQHRIFKAVLSFLDVIVALLIIFTATSVSATPFGRLSLVFGFLILAISVVVRFMQLW